MSFVGALRSRIGSQLVAAGLAGVGALTCLQQGGWLQTAHLEEEAPQPKGALDPNEWRLFKVVQKEQVTHNTQKLRFATPSPDDDSGLFVASCLLTRAPIGSEKEDGSRKAVIRPYTPVTTPDTKGYFDLLVKEYPEGKMSKHICSLDVGQGLECKGPIPKLPYKANMKKRIGMISGGSGITPMLQIVQEVLRNPEDKTEVSLIFANISDKDILLKQTFDDMAAKHKNFKVFYVVDKVSSFWWRGGVGYITKDMIKQHMPPPSDDSLILVCGPPGMMKFISGDKAKDKSQGPLEGLLKDLGYSPEGVFKF